MRKSVQETQNNQSGFSIVELVVALALFSVFIGGAAILVVGAYTSTLRGEKLTQAALSSQQAFEAVNSIAGYQYNQLAAGDYALYDSSGEWELTATSGSNDVTVTIEDVERDSSDDITTTGTDDPHTRLVTATVNYEVNEANTRTIEASQYITDWGASSELETTDAQFSAGTGTDIEVTTDDDGEIRIAASAYMEVGTVSGVGDTATTVNLENEYESPVVVAVHLQSNNTDPITTRVSNVTSTSFDVRLQEATYGSSSITTDDVYYIVVEEGTWTFGDDDTIVQAGTIDTDVVQTGLGGGWNNGEAVDFVVEFNSDPVVFHQVSTENSTDWITSYVGSQASNSQPPTTTGMDISLHGAEVTSVHQNGGTDVSETIGWIAFDGDVTSTIGGSTPFETVVTPDEVRESGMTYTLATTYTDPVGLVSKLEEDGSNGAFHMMDGLSSTEITMHPEEDVENDSEQTHTWETFGYAVFDEPLSVGLTNASLSTPAIEVGEYSFETDTDVVLESGTVSVNGTSWTSVSFTNITFTDPIVVAKQMENNNSFPVSVRVDNVSSTGFDVILQTPSTSTPAAEDVYFLAVERGAWEWNGYQIEADSTTTSTVSAAPRIGGSWTGVSQSYSHTWTSAPIVLHQVMTANDSSWITSIVYSSGGRTFVPGTSAFQISMNGAEATATHGSSEELGWIAIEDGLDFLYDSVQVETNRDTGVRGHDDGCYTTTYTTINSANSFAVHSQMEMDGNDGGWGVQCSSSATSIGFHVEEDQQRDSERRNVTETFGFIAFSDALVIESAGAADWQEIALDNTYASPVVIVTGFESATTGPFSARVRNVDSDSFEVILQSSDGTYGVLDSLHYMVIEEGTWQIGSTKIEADSEEISTVAASSAVGGSWTGDSKSYSHTYSGDPIVLHQVMTTNDTDWITSWVSEQGTRTNPPDTNGFQIALNGAEVTSTHDPETIGWVVIANNGSDTHEGTDFYTAIENPGMNGHDNGCYTSTFGTTMTDPIVIASQQEMDGADGSWLSMCSLSTTQAGFHAEEDQETNTERGHTSEAYGYIVFDQAFSDPGTTVSGGSGNGEYESVAFGPWSNVHIIEWTEDENGCSTCDVQLQVRTASSAAGLSSATWYGPTGAGTYFEDPSGSMLHSDHLGDSYFQYKIVLTGDSGGTQIVEDVTISYTP